MMPCTRKVLAAIVLLSWTLPAPWVAAQTESSRYVGAETCGNCHEEIFLRQSASRMARTWRSPGQGFPSQYRRQIDESERSYQVMREGDRLFFEVRQNATSALKLPVDAVTGGERFGIGFLLKVAEVAGHALPRPALVEARYMEDPKRGALIRAPGHASFQPNSLHAALGRVLNPSFEERCLTCHGSPDHTETREAGIRCERCHGPGADHLEAIDQGSEELRILRPGEWSSRRVVELCSECHSGFSELVQPRPQDLLISDQARALTFSECFIQSDGGFSCIDCHDPHTDAVSEDPRYQATCLKCHTLDGQEAASCPISPDSGCTGCHMKSIEQEGLHLVDHWIRVHPDQVNSETPKKRQSRSQVKPQRLYLRLIRTRSRDEAEALRQRAIAGASFALLARDHSIDRSAAVGGYLGALSTKTLQADFSRVSTSLSPGEVSPVFEANGQFLILHRMERDFRSQAIALEERATAQRRAGNNPAAIQTLRQALDVDPGFLGAMHSLAVAYASQSNLQETLTILTRAQQMFPDDPTTPYLLGRAQGAIGRHQSQLESLRQAVRLNPNMTAAHLQLGSVYYSQQRYEDAIRHFRAALRINPLSAAAHYNLARCLQATGQAEEASRAMEIARTLEPELTG